MSDTPTIPSQNEDGRTRDWWVDRIMAALVWLAGISAIVAIVGIFVFITKEGVGFFGPDFDVVEFLSLIHI